MAIQMYESCDLPVYIFMNDNLVFSLALLMATSVLSNKNNGTHFSDTVTVSHGLTMIHILPLSACQQSITRQQQLDII